jgi:uncharacterized protein (TIGR00369 family)
VLDKNSSMPLSGEDIMRQFLPTSPYVAHLGIRLVSIQPGEAVLALPFAPEIVTIGTTVHGGALASLIDTAAMVAAWSDAPVPDKIRGSTVNLTITYLAPANHEDLQATAHVLRRGKSLVYIDIDVQGASSGAVAKGLATYKIG